MKITKIGHCCLVLEEQGTKIMTDPGSFTKAQEEMTGLHAILITHEHGDHLHVESLKTVLVNNPTARVITNSSVGKILDGQGLTYELTQEGDTTMVNDIFIEAFGSTHEEIFNEFGLVQNTGYFIGNKLFYPGDAFTNPGKPVDILALPVAGPWCRLKDAVKYALAVRPRAAFPVHDGMIIPEWYGGFHLVPEKILSEEGIQFLPLTNGGSIEL